LKKVTYSIVITLTALFLGIANASASGVSVAPILSTMTTPGPYEGIFTGNVNGDNNSQAPITLVLTHRGEDVEGVVSLGEGLYVNAGMCGGANVPPSEQSFTVKTQPGKPRELSTQLAFNVGNYQVGVDLESLISDDGKMITSQVGIDLPWICGRDPMLTGTLYRTE